MTNHWADFKNANVILIMGSNCAENHPVAWQHIWKAKEDNSAKIISVDPRYTRTSAKADIYAPIRSGTDIVFLGGMIRYAIENVKYNAQYVKDCTNGPFKVSTDYKGPRHADNPGNFSASTTWDYQYTGDATWTANTSYALNAIVVPTVASNFQYKCTTAGTSHSTTEPIWPVSGTILDGTVTWTCILPIKKPIKVTLDDSDCVFQKLKEQYSVYTPEMVERICGTPRGLFLEICQAYIDGTYADNKAGTMLYAMGWTQHTVGVQNIRAATILQSLLGNMGVAGGGINALRGWHNVQGATDHALLYHYLPGYNPSPKNISGHAKLGTGPQDLTDTFLKKTIPLAMDPDAPTPPESGNWWGNRPKYLISNLKAWWPTIHQNISWSYIPKRGGTLGADDYSYLSLIKAIEDETIEGLFVWGSNPMVMGPDQGTERPAMDKLKWLVVCDLFETETSNFWKRPRTDGKGPVDVNTEVYLLPGAAFFEKKGSVTNSGRLAQWKDKACNPPGGAEPAKDELNIVTDIGTAIKGLYSVTLPSLWVANTSYALDALVRNTGTNNGAQYKCTTAGTSHATTEPSPWPTNIGDTVVDGTVTWTCVNLLNAGITNLNWPYDSAQLGADMTEGVAKEINGYALSPFTVAAVTTVTPNIPARPYAVGELVDSFFHLQLNGNTACGNWLFSGTWQAAGTLTPPYGNRMALRDPVDYHPANIGIYYKWGYSWPVNRRIIYNRASVYQNNDTGAGTMGTPLNPSKRVVYWDNNIFPGGANNASKWNGGCSGSQLNDVVDGYATNSPAVTLPYIMNEEGVARLMAIVKPYATTLKDGAFPEHWEPKETPLTANPLTSGLGPLVSPYTNLYAGATFAPPGSTDYPIVCTTYRLSEHWHGGGMTRNLPGLAELQPEPFIEISEELAINKGIVNGDDVKVWSARNSGVDDYILVKACVTKRFKPFVIDGQLIHQVGMPWHWGYVSALTPPCTGDSANILTPFIGDANTRIPEYKAFLVDIAKA